MYTTQLVDTLDGLAALRNRLLSSPGMNAHEAWLDYIAPYPEIRMACELDAAASGYELRRDVEPVLRAALLEHYDRVEEARRNAQAAYSRVEARFSSVFGTADDVVLVLYASLCNGAGWATTFRGKPAIFLGVEKIAELEWHTRGAMQALICHELCHVAHSLLRAQSLDCTAHDPVTRASWQLYVEGFAQRYQQVLLDSDAFNQDRHGWRDWCRGNLPHIRAEYLSRLLNGQSVQAFFGDWTSFEGHSDVGYFLGCEFVRSLQSTMNTSAVAGLDAGTVSALVISYLGGSSDEQVPG